MALAVSCGNNMQFLNPTDGTVHASVTPCAARSLAVRKEWVYASQRKEAAITIWRMGQKSPHVKCRLGEIMGALIVSPDGAYIFAGGASGSLYVWESWSGSLVRRFTAHHKAVRCLGVTDDFSFLISGGDDAVLSVWPVLPLVDVDDDSSAVIRDFHSWTDHVLGVTDVHVGRGGVCGRIFSASLDRTARVFELFSRQLLYTVSCGTFITSIVASPDEAWMYLGTGDGTIVAVDLVSAAMQNFTATGEVVMETGQTRHSMEGHSQAITGLIVVEYGRMLVSSSEDGTVRLWDAPSKQCLNEMDLKAPITCMSLANHFTPRTPSPTKASKEQAAFSAPPLRKYVTNRGER